VQVKVKDCVMAIQGTIASENASKILGVLKALQAKAIMNGLVINGQ
jgi:hypothetical protein